MKTTLNCNVLRTVNQERTPLTDLFFSEFNVSLIQRATRQKFKNTTGIAIDKQNQDDLIVIMRAIYIENSMFGFNDICSQVKWMNQKTIDFCLSQINTGVSQQIDYFRDASQLYTPNPLPISTSLYGKKMDYNTKIGL